MEPIKLSKYIETLKELYKDHKDTLPLYYAIDDEGNDFKPVFYEPGTITLDGMDHEQVICIN